MAYLLEDGTGVAGSNAYVTENEADAYADDHLLTDWQNATSGKEEAIIRASAAIDARYRTRYTGWRSHGRLQGMEWPRTDAYDDDDELIASTEIPTELKHAVIEAAVRELVSPGSMMPDLDRGGALKRVKAGSVEVEYADNAAATTTYTIIDGILGRILRGSLAAFAGRATRV